ncbi:MAG: metallophosphoesterase family protein [Saccharofermentanales bacterium]
MKIVVFTDSHNDVDTMLTVIKKEQPDKFLHLGDNISDGFILQNIQDIIVYFVKGNTDKTSDSLTPHTSCTMPSNHPLSSIPGFC